MEAALALQEKLQAATAEFQKMQTDLSGVVEARQRLDAQLSENELVKKVRREWFSSRYQTDSLLLGQQEFSKLTPNNTVYKLIGPVLVPQDQGEAKGNVEKRLEFIRSDM